MTFYFTFLFSRCSGFCFLFLYLLYVYTFLCIYFTIYTLCSLFVYLQDQFKNRNIIFLKILFSSTFFCSRKERKKWEEGWDTSFLSQQSAKQSRKLQYTWNTGLPQWNRWLLPKRKGNGQVARLQWELNSVFSFWKWKTLHSKGLYWWWWIFWMLCIKTFSSTHTEVRVFSLSQSGFPQTYLNTGVAEGLMGPRFNILAQTARK